jgi:hypothetical protein
MKAALSAIACVTLALSTAPSATAQVARPILRAQTERVNDAVENQVRQAAEPHLSRGGKGSSTAPGLSGEQQAMSDPARAPGAALARKDTGTAE